MSPRGLLLTVAICTYNRAESLRRTLTSLSAMQLPCDFEWEVVVVNNNCTDHTDSVIEEFRDRLPIRREFEAQQGLSNARNRAVDVANGDYIVWTDDDVVVDANWLAAYKEAFRQWPRAAVFGGPILLKFEPPTPTWLIESHQIIAGAFAGRDLGKSTQLLSIAGNRIPNGANFALRTAEQRSFRYDPNLGHMPGRKRIGEESDVIARIFQAGGVGYWIPQAKVAHWIPTKRQTVQYLVHSYAAQGETSQFLCETETALIGDNGAPPLWFGVPRWCWRALAEHWCLYRLHRLVSPPSVWVDHLTKYAAAKGAIDYRWRTMTKNSRLRGARSI